MPFSEQMVLREESIRETKRMLLQKEPFPPSKYPKHSCSKTKGFPDFVL